MEGLQQHLPAFWGNYDPVPPKYTSFVNRQLMLSNLEWLEICLKAAWQLTLQSPVENPSNGVLCCHLCAVLGVERWIGCVLQKQNF